MKNILIYYVLIFLPLIFLIYVAYTYNNILFFILLSLYVLIYRPIIDFKRLKIKGVDINFFKLYNPIVYLKYFKELYLS